jgi:hypothetical protein
VAGVRGSWKRWFRDCCFVMGLSVSVGTGLVVTCRVSAIGVLSYRFIYCFGDSGDSPVILRNLDMSPVIVSLYL